MNTFSHSSQQKFYLYPVSIIPAPFSANTSTTSSVIFPPLSSHTSQTGTLPPVYVCEGLSITDPSSGRHAQVSCSFAITLYLEDEAYIASSSIADLYELGETASEAVSRYLSSLVDELLWLQERKDSLSAHLTRVYQTLQSYLCLE
jgi:hypothetical protein